MSLRPVVRALLASAATFMFAACTTAELEPRAGAPGMKTTQMADVSFQASSIPSPAARPGTTVSVNGADIFVTDTGGAGEPVVLLHGYPLSGALFERVKDELDDDFRVITVDHRGYGKSSLPGEVRVVGTYAADALAVLDRLDIGPAHIGGMSMGGPIVFEMYRRDPSAFASMILIDTNHKPANAIEKGIWQGTRAALNSGGVDSIIPFLMPNMLTGQTRLVGAPEQVDYLTSAMNQASLRGALGGTHVLENRPDSTATLRTVKVPALVLVGREDTLYPVAISQAMADALPQGELVVIPGAAHAAIFERPAASAAAIAAFLDGI